MAGRKNANDELVASKNYISATLYIEITLAFIPHPALKRYKIKKIMQKDIEILYFNGKEK